VAQTCANSILSIRSVSNHYLVSNNNDNNSTTNNRYESLKTRVRAVTSVALYLLAYFLKNFADAVW